ncbi:hypothetical protein BJV82DRAFT_717776 [Fennellomyces sp. T-0311]|nr:hypothetical protein BJV82DRAFT_717776 [Fennellomyces sp. T-0311]
MCITYDTHQHNVENIYGECGEPYFCPVTHFTPEHPRAGIVDIPEFKPSRLIRTSDMAVVRGSDVHAPYYALSYSWEQSGIIVQGDDSENSARVDNSKHHIISHPKNKEDEQVSSVPVNTRSVTFEGLIQQICQDFDFQYIWYDQKCTIRKNPDDKRREVKDMHRIFRHAQCTVVLIPELHVVEQYISSSSFPRRANVEVISTSEWSKHVWTLNESLVSERLLFIGRDVHLWSYVYDRSNPFQTVTFVNQDSFKFLYDICTTSKDPFLASALLWHARRRNCTKNHDRIFALASLFPNIAEVLPFDYSRDLYAAMLHFYGLLAQQDLSLLCFGCPMKDQDDSNDLLDEMKLLPSWTGVFGHHGTTAAGARTIGSMWYHESYVSTASNTTWTVNGQFLQLTCNCIYASIERNAYEPYGSFKCVGHYEREFSVPSGSSHLIFNVRLDEQQLCTAHYADGFFLKDTHWLPVMVDSGQEKDEDGGYYKWVNNTITPTHSGGALLLVDVDCTECIILTGIVFDKNASSKAMPVIKQNDDGYYCCIGVCLLDGYAAAYHYPEPEREQTFIIV